MRPGPNRSFLYRRRNSFRFGKSKRNKGHSTRKGCHATGWSQKPRPERGNCICRAGTIGPGVAGSRHSASGLCCLLLGRRNCEEVFHYSGTVRPGLPTFLFYQQLSRSPVQAKAESMLAASASPIYRSVNPMPKFLCQHQATRSRSPSPESAGLGKGRPQPLNLIFPSCSVTLPNLNRQRGISHARRQNAGPGYPGSCG